MQNDDDDEERRRKQRESGFLPHGDTRPPNYYDPLKAEHSPPDQTKEITSPKPSDELAAGQTRLYETLAADRPSPPHVSTLREDNAELTTAKAEKQYAETRRLHHEEIDRQARENAAALIKLSEEMRSVAEKKDPFKAIEEKRIERPDNLNTRDGESYFRKALEDQRGSGDACEQLARAASAEYAAFYRDQDRLQQHIDKEQDHSLRAGLERLKDAHAANYLAATSHRIADQWEIVTGSKTFEDAENARAQAQSFERDAKKLQDIHRTRTQHPGQRPEPLRTGEEAMQRKNEDAKRSRESSSGRFDSADKERERLSPNTSAESKTVPAMEEVARHGGKDRTENTGKDSAYGDRPKQPDGRSGSTSGGRGGRSV